jgi:hypothetical protein
MGGESTAVNSTPVPNHVPLRFSRGADDKIVQSAGGDELLLDPANFPVWRKAALTRAARIPRPFTVETTEGVMTCEDGWLAVDTEGNPYPIARDVFEKSYESVPRSTTTQRGRGAMFTQAGESYDSLRLAVLTFLERYDGDLVKERKGEPTEWRTHEQGADGLLQHLTERGFEVCEIGEAQ